MTKYINFFESYSKKYMDMAQDDFKKYHINRKIEHSKRVNKFAIAIAKDLGLNDHQLYLIDISSLLHDIGRFKQFYEYGTYIDKLSFNHGDVGVSILEEENILSDLSSEDKDTICEIIKIHNYPSIPSDIDDSLRLYASIIRDADKLDWMYAMENIIKDAKDEDKKIFFGNRELIDDIRNEVCMMVLNGDKVNKTDLQTVGELKIWTIFSLLTEYECKASIDIIKNNDLINKVYSDIKDSKEKEMIYNYVMNKLDDKKFTYFRYN